MKIKLNSNYKSHDTLVKRLSEELPELTIRSKERTWGEEKPSFKFRKKLYEFDNIDEFMNQAIKILKLTDKDYNKKTKFKAMETDPKEKGKSKEVEELLLEIPVEKYNLQDLNIKLRLGSHSEKGSTYESNEQTLHYEVKESDDESADTEVDTKAADISMTSMNNDIILDIPSEKFSLNDLNLNIKFTQYGEENSTYEVKKMDKKDSPAEKNRKNEQTADKPSETKKVEEPAKTEDANKKDEPEKAPAPKKTAAARKPAASKKAAEPKTSNASAKSGGVKKPAEKVQKETAEKTETTKK